MKKLNEKKQRETRIRAKLLVRTERPRLTVKRSNQHIFAQIIDQTGRVMAAFGSASLRGAQATKQSIKMTKTESAGEVGKKLGEIAKDQKITTLVFDRGSYRFHGRVKALAEAVRAAGIKF